MEDAGDTEERERERERDREREWAIYEGCQETYW
jgi:hypothetical protein